MWSRGDLGVLLGCSYSNEMDGVEEKVCWLLPRSHPAVLPLLGFYMGFSLKILVKQKVLYS